MNKVRINQGRVLESGQRYLFSMLLVAAMVGLLICQNNLLGFVFMMILSTVIILLWTSFRVAEIDLKNRTYGERTSIMGRSFGKVRSYDGIENVSIERVMFGTQNDMVEYDAYLKFTNGERLFLVSGEEEKELRKRLQPILKKLRTEVESRGYLKSTNPHITKSINQQIK